uniref:cGMP-dependent protein kinase n=1 Tax=Chrysotila carterae TaxID=13221 RepID=A0A7S4BY39_CHRCT
MGCAGSKDNTDTAAATYKTPEPAKPSEPEPPKPKEPEPPKPKEPEPPQAKAPEPQKSPEPEPQKAPEPEPPKPVDPEPKKAPEPEPEPVKPAEPEKPKVPEPEPAAEPATKPVVPEPEPEPAKPAEPEKPKVPEPQPAAEPTVPEPVPVEVVSPEKVGPVVDQPPPAQADANAPPPAKLASDPKLLETGVSSMSTAADGGKKANRRVGVSAEGSTKNVELPQQRNSTIEKSDETRNLILKSISTNLLFAGMDAAGLHSVVDAMESEMRAPPQEVIKEGDVGDYFYVVESGEFQVFLSSAGDDPVHTYVVDAAKPAPNFGDLALLYSCPRKATVRCSKEGRVWRLEASRYMKITHEAAMAAKEKNMQFLRSVSLLSPLEDDQIDALASSLEPVSFNDGEVVVKQGDAADALYFIKEGKVNAFVASAGDAPVATMQSGQFFGENAVSGEDEPKRAATVKAAGDVELLKLSRDAFADLIGDLAETVAANFSEKVLGGVEIFKALNEDERQLLANSLEEAKYSEGENIIVKGEEGEKFYIIVSGGVRVTSGEEVIKDHLGPGNYFGETAILKRQPRMATVTATSDTTCMMLDRSTFNKVLGPMNEILARETARREEEAARIKAAGKIQFEDLEQRNILGVGTFGRVRLVVHTPTQTPYALKCMRKGQVVALKQVEHVMNEKNILAMCNHPFLLGLAATFKDEEELYMLMELSLGGELFSVLRDRVKFDEPAGRFYAANVASAFEYLHSRKIVYRDLKPENLLLDADGYLKVVDFGFAKIIEGRTWTLCGTPEYLAPEIISNKGHNLAVDWWALGILIFELLNGTPPFTADDPMDIYQKILRGKIAYPVTLGKTAREACQKFLLANPAARMCHLKRGVREVREHPFFKPINFDELYNKVPKAPLIPRISDPLDTSNFDYYEDEDGSEWARFNDKRRDFFKNF